MFFLLVQSVKHSLITDSQLMLQCKMQGVYKNLLLGLEFDPIIPGTPKLKGEVVLRTMLGIPLSHSKWWDLTAILVIFISYRLLFLVIAKLKERASPLFWTLHANKILQHLDKKSSVKKKPSCPSKRHHPPHSLSSQEGLSSPLAQKQQQKHIESETAIVTFYGSCL